MRDVIGLILGGGQGTRLFPLTQFRSKPGVPIGGKYRLIDIPISNCIHSDINRIFVLTQFNSASLHRHISTTYRFDSFTNGFWPPNKPRIVLIGTRAPPMRCASN